MARKKASDKLPDELTQEAADKIGERDAELALQDYMQSIAPEGAKFYVYRIVAGRHRYIATHDGALTEEDILGEYGPGTYFIRANVAGKWVGNRRIDIEGRESGSDIPMQMVAGNGNGNADSLNQRIFLMMQDSANKQHETLIALIGAMAGKSGASFDPAALMGAMFTGVSAIQQLTPKTPGGLDLDGVTKIMDIAERFGGNGGGPKGTLETVIDAASKILPSILEVRSLGAGDTVSSYRYRNASECPGFNPCIDNLVICQNCGSHQGNHSNPPAKEPVRLPANTDKTETLDPRIQIQKDIKILWERLTKAAHKEMDPEGLAASLMDLEELDDMAAGAIIQSAYQAATFEEWQKQTSAIADSIRPWFELFYKAVKELTKEGGTDAATSDDSPGNAGNAGHAKAD